MNTFPASVGYPQIADFADEYSDAAVGIASSESGYPIPNALFTFDPRTFHFVLRRVTDANKRTLMAFYQANKDLCFYWLNRQDNTIYEVMFVQKPACRVDNDDDKDLWQIDIVLIQTSPTELSAGVFDYAFYGGDVMIDIENVAAGADITDRPVYVVSGHGLSIAALWLLTKGAPAGINNSNTVVLTLKKNGSNVIVTKTFNTGTQPPTSGVLDLSSLLDDDNTILDEGEYVTLSLAQGATANMPAFSLVIGGSYT